MLLLIREAIDGDKILAAILSILGPSPSIPVALVEIEVFSAIEVCLLPSSLYYFIANENGADQIVHMCRPNCSVFVCVCHQLSSNDVSVNFTCEREADINRSN